MLVHRSGLHPQEVRNIAQWSQSFAQGFLIPDGTLLADVVCVLAKCANHTCTNPFLYLTHGKLFHFPRREERGTERILAMESFWLCTQCSRQMTLQWRRGQGVIAVPLEHRRTNIDQPAY